MDNISQKVISLIGKYAKMDLTPDSLLSSANLSPVDTIMIFIETEQIFNIEIPNEEHNFLKVSDYVDYITNLVYTVKNIDKLN